MQKPQPWAGTTMAAKAYPLMPAPTTDQLRDNIDKGRTGEKVSMPDPATVPLGTDAEAGGNPPTAKERAMDVAATPGPSQGRVVPGGMVYLVLVFVLALALIGIVLLAAR
jgi:hypothetical protein